MKNKKYEGSVDTAGKMPFMSQKIDDAENLLVGNPEKKGRDKTIELEDRIIEVHDK